MVEYSKMERGIRKEIQKEGIFKKTLLGERDEVGKENTRKGKENTKKRMVESCEEKFHTCSQMEASRIDHEHTILKGKQIRGQNVENKNCDLQNFHVKRVCWNRICA